MRKIPLPRLNVMVVIVSLIISSGCTFTPPTFTPINTHQFHRADAATTPPSRLLARILELVPGNAEVSSPTPIVIAGNPDVMDMMDMMATTPPLTTPIPTLISLTAHADVFCVGGVCDQMWLRGPVEVVIEPDHFRASLQQISARSGDGSVHLTGRLTRYDYTNPLVDLSQSEMVLTAGDTIITMDRDAALFINDSASDDNHLEGIFITGSEAAGVYLDGQFTTP